MVLARSVQGLFRIQEMEAFCPPVFPFGLYVDQLPGHRVHADAFYTRVIPESGVWDESAGIPIEQPTVVPSGQGEKRAATDRIKIMPVCLRERDLQHALELWLARFPVS